MCRRADGGDCRSRQSEEGLGAGEAQQGSAGDRRNYRRGSCALLEGAAAGDPRPVARRHLPAASGAAGRDPQAGWGQTRPRHPKSAPAKAGVLDRFVQQAALQVLQGEWDGTFSASSYGFRPGRSAHQAVARAQEHIAAGRRWVVDIDLEKFFDRVNHDKLMSQVARRIVDRRLLHLIRSWLKAGVLENGLVGQTEEGTPQGGPLSPLLSNLVLDRLDREL